MRKTKLTCEQMIKKIQDVQCDNKGICIYVKGKFSKSTYFCNFLEIEEYQSQVCFKDSDACGLEFSLTKDGIKEICTYKDFMGENIDIIIKNDIVITIMIV